MVSPTGRVLLASIYLNTDYNGYGPLAPPSFVKASPVDEKVLRAFGDQEFCMLKPGAGR
jgi:hypothetical protein